MKIEFSEFSFSLSVTEDMKGVSEPDFSFKVEIDPENVEGNYPFPEPSFDDNLCHFEVVASSVIDIRVMAEFFDYDGNYYREVDTVEEMSKNCGLSIDGSAKILEAIVKKVKEFFNSGLRELKYFKEE